MRPDAVPAYLADLPPTETGDYLGRLDRLPRRRATGSGQLVVATQEHLHGVVRNEGDAPYVAGRRIHRPQ